MKKALALILVLTMALALAACGGAPAASTANSTAAASKPAASVASTADESVAEEPADESANLADYLTEAYQGAMDSSDEIICLAFNEDASLSILTVSGETESVSFVGEGVDNGDGSMTIADEENGMTITFSIALVADSTITIDMGDLGTATLIACDPSEVVNTLELIAENTTAVA